MKDASSDPAPVDQLTRERLRLLRVDADRLTGLGQGLVRALDGGDPRAATGLGALAALALPRRQDERASIARALGVAPALVERAALGRIDAQQWGVEAVAILAYSMGLSKETAVELILREESRPLSRGRSHEQVAAVLSSDSSAPSRRTGDTSAEMDEGWSRMCADFSDDVSEG